jgi:hypothetical protein
MISGPAIDEQRALRPTTMTANQHPIDTSLSVAEQRDSARDAGSDEEFDPNDIVQVTDTPQRSQDDKSFSSSETDWDSDD